MREQWSEPSKKVIDREWQTESERKEEERE